MRSSVSPVKSTSVLIVPLWNWNGDAGVSARRLCCFNRTFMELKWWRGYSPRCIWEVLIVPLWNWNPSCVHYPSALSSVLILPLWNWNIVSTELELLKNGVLIVPLWNWNLYVMGSAYADGSFNRTFMELKSARNKGTHSRNRVLIVPLWNWNCR